MKEILILKELEQIKAISQPYRMDILECFDKDQPATAKQIADKIGEPHAKINYHIKTLQKVGILELVDERVKSGIIEKYYLPTAKTFIIHKCILNDTDLDQEAIETFENVAKDFYRTVKAANEKEFFDYHHCHLTPQEAEELKGKLYNTVEAFIKNKSHKEENEKTYSIATFIIPKLGEND